MYVVCVTVKVIPRMGTAFLEATHRNRMETRKERGNVRFDILQGATPADAGQPEEFFLLEVYRDADDFTAHQQTPHYLQFRDDVAEMMAEPRRGVHYRAVDSDPWE